jgi:hypothetical protein
MSDKQTEEINLNYQVNSLPGQIRQLKITEKISSARERAKIKMYLLFLIGTLCLVGISYLTIDGVTFNGATSYWNYIISYWNKFNWLATVSLIIMLVVNIFWVLVNVLIEFLANSQKWIPEKKSESVRKSFFSREKNKSKIYKDTNKTDNPETEINKQLEQEQEDKEEYEAILANSALSPLAFLWLGLKKFYRLITYIPRRLYTIIKALLAWNEELWQEIKLFFKDSWEFILYFLNPLNLLDEIIDTAVTILVKIFYPALLTPIIFFTPIRNGIVFTTWWHILLYFITIGGLRLGVEFFSIYIRFLRNTRN